MVLVQILGAKPGVLSEELRRALGMGESSPPPWLINMQRYGPPPSYPDLKVRPQMPRISKHIGRSLIGIVARQSVPASSMHPTVI